MAVEEGNAGGTAVAEAPITWGGAPTPSAGETAASDGGQAASNTGTPASDPVTDNGETGNPGADAGDETSDAAASAYVDPVAEALRIQPDAAETAQPRAAAPAQDARNAPASDPAPTLPDAIATKLNEALGTDAGTDLVGAINKTFADMHAKIGQVAPIAQRVESVAYRQQREDAERYDQTINSVFDSLHDEGLDVYGKGDTAKTHARQAVHQRANEIAGGLMSNPKALTALKSKLGVTSNNDPKLRTAIFKSAHADIYGTQPTKKEAVEQVRRDVQTRHAQRTVRPGGRSAGGNGGTDTSYEGLKSIWR